EIHSKTQVDYFDAKPKVLANSRDWLGDVEDCITAYLFITYKYFDKLRDSLETIDFTPYLEQLKQEFEDWKQRFVIDDSWKELDETLFYAKEVEWFVFLEGKGEFKDREGKVSALRNNLMKKDNKYQMVLLGTAGMGKTSTSRYLTVTDANKLLNQKFAAIPVYLEMKNFNKDKSLFEHIVAQFQTKGLNKYNDLADIITRHLARGKIHLFLDGWNELNRDLATGVTREIKQLMRRYPNVFMLITTRQESYQNDFEGVPAFVLQDMKLAQIQEFVKKNTLPQETGIRAEIQGLQPTDRLFEFICVPFYTRMFVQARRRGNVPNTIVDFIKVFIDQLLQRERSHKENFLNFEEFKHALAYLAYVCATEKSNNNNAALTRAEINAILYRPESGIEREQVKTYLDHAVQLHILVYEDYFYSFAHHDYQGYFAGLGKRLFARNQPVNYENASLFNMIRFDVGLDKARESRIRKEILPNNVHLAALCKVDCFDPEPELTQAIIKQAQWEIAQQTASVVTPMFALVILKELATLGEKLALQPKHQAVLARNLEANQYVYNVLLATASFSDAQRIFAESTRHFPLLPDPMVQRNYVISYSTLINKSPDFATAEKFVQEMRAQGIKLDEISYNPP
ncbi:MAG: NACHT domain-containing protein, partial [Thiotrichaceae bacterium]